MQRNIFFLKVTKNEGVILHKKSRKLQKRNFRDFFRRASRPHSKILIQPHRHRESKLDVARPITRGYQRIRDVVVVVEADFETLRNLVVGGGLDGVTALTGGNFVVKFLDFAEDGLVVVDYKIHAEVEVALGAGDSRGGLDVERQLSEFVTKANDPLFFVCLGDLRICKGKGDEPCAAVLHLGAHHI